MPEHDYLDITMITEGTEATFHATNYKSDLELALVDAVATGRLYVLNGKGEFEKILAISYWKGEAILNVSCNGHESDENGEITRDWRSKVFGSSE